MNALILHHYDISNFSEKVRMMLGFKDLSWYSVEIPATAPKPDYTPLTGGYRRTPALQMGAEVYCDTRLIADVLEDIAPSPSLFPGPNPARTRALSDGLAAWAEGQLLWPLALYITGVKADRFPPRFHADRARLHGKPAPKLDRVKAAAQKNLAHMRSQLLRLGDLLSGDQTFILGDRASLADFAAYHVVWFLETIGGPSALLDRQPHTRAWIERIKAIGHGHPTPMRPSQALDCALKATPTDWSAGSKDDAPEGVALGDEVIVSPLDEDSPASGRLIYHDDRRIVLRCRHRRVGEINVHFPRLGYRLGRA
jgi:glutathione S-transferase